MTFFRFDVRPLAVVAVSAVVAASFLGSSATADLSKMGDSRTRSPIKTCRQAGLCGKSEKGVIVQGDAAITAAKEKGCKVGRKTRQGTAMRCPSTAAVQYAVEDRAFRTTDIFALGQMGADQVHAAGVTGAGVRIAVLDMGVDASHPELADAVALTKNFSADASATDGGGHGTHVSGIIAGAGLASLEDRGSTNRALGVAPGADLIVGKVCSDEGWCLESDVIAGIEWAVEQHAKVINLSLGGGSFLGHCDLDSLAQAANWAVSQGTVVVAAAGNIGESGEGVMTPACGSKVIAVGAVDSSDARLWWSAYGTALDVMAPGLDILSSVPCAVAGTCPTAGYGWWSGTSMAAPQVTGLVGLLVEAEPTLTTDEIYAIVTGTAADLGEAGADTLTGYGRVNASAAVSSAQSIVRASSSSSVSSSSTTSSSSSVSSSSSSSVSSSSSAGSSSSSSSSQPSSSSSASSSSQPSSSFSSSSSLWWKEGHPEKPWDWNPFRWFFPPLPDQASDNAREHRPDEHRGEGPGDNRGPGGHGGQKGHQ